MVLGELKLLDLEKVEDCVMLGGGEGLSSIRSLMSSLATGLRRGS